MKIRSLIFLIPIVLGAQVSQKPTAQSPANQILDPAKLMKPPTDAWPTYNGDYSGRRFSTLRQINQSNVKAMTLAWVYRATGGVNGPGTIVGGLGQGPPPLAARENNGLQIKATPLMLNGVLYFASPDNAWAV